MVSVVWICRGTFVARHPLLSSPPLHFQSSSLLQYIPSIKGKITKSPIKGFWGCSKWCCVGLHYIIYVIFWPLYDNVGRQHKIIKSDTRFESCWINTFFSQYQKKALHLWIEFSKNSVHCCIVCCILHLIIPNKAGPWGMKKENLYCHHQDVVKNSSVKHFLHFTSKVSNDFSFFRTHKIKYN